MEKNFLIDQGIALSCEGNYFDIHNCYDFQGFNFDAEGKIFYLNFTRASDSQKLKQNISIKFIDIDVLELSDDFVSHINFNLSEIGYKSAADRDYDWLIGEDKASPEDHLFFRFESDQYIRIYGRQVTVEYQ